MNTKKLRSVIAKIVCVFLGIFFSLSLAIPAAAAPAQNITRGPTTERVVALTFDDGADGTNINTILQTLSNHNIKATFFLTGTGINNHPQRIRNIVNQGHEVANHSYTHPDFTTITRAQIRSELQRTEEAVLNLTGVSTKPFFRPPFGAYNSTVLQHVGDAGYRYSVYWTIDTIDWTGNSSTDIVNRVMSRITPGAIILMHTGAGARGTPAALPTIITRLKGLGYRFVTMSQLMNLQAAPSGRTYTVRPGDTLYSIALRYPGVSVQQIVNASNISNPNLISIGRVLTIPSSGSTTPPPSSTVTYTVRPGDTLYSIALRYNTTVARIVSVNNISNPNLISIGRILTIPSTGSTTPPPSSTVTYTVRPGDTLYSIALRYNTTVTRIASVNNISNTSLIRVGQVLTIR
ncbi:LysM peptidoglycan-binding domain-containing protein [Alkalibacterium olivapovliticus]|uniref:Peptidoglycan/xylan/chitin deacetylase (PgdA/CDA1 family) n=1 Tax=Alkalibacterium olivapovliticus TaxID=99907 RepID=A0A2T0W5V1_9LACT|nr:LysM peptidoglycan-binding domain-containing protein [Alkalibacterium olivapovliticus]PRY81457.1 peptidoglycan/xylan/chitin deacetylase (PgdA/CDA1 family) [Alkalibacterium olivapovliticus]